jgi:hypothetical protein
MTDDRRFIEDFLTIQAVSRKEAQRQIFEAAAFSNFAPSGFI